MIFDWSVISLELFTTILGLGVVLLGLLFPGLRNKATLGYLTIAGLIIILLGSTLIKTTVPTYFINEYFVQDSLSLLFKQIFLIVSILVSLIAIPYFKSEKNNRSDFFGLAIFALVGMMIMASAKEFITLYLGLEFMTLTFVILTAYLKQNLKSGEAGLKYIILSAVSTGIFLYGLSFVYALTGSLEYGQIVGVLSQQGYSPMLMLALTMVLVGFSFKITLVPFHMWAPDIYEGAPTPITAFLAVGSKAAGFIALIRVLFEVFAANMPVFMPIVILLTMLTMIIGNLIALAQTQMKRLLAYSSIAHVGYIILGIIAYTQLGISAILFYLVLYMFSNIGAFAAIIAISAQTGSDKIADLAGLWRNSPFSASILLICLLSLAGIPPTAGFIGKFFLFTEAIKQGYLFLVFLALIMSLVSIYYYIMVIRTLLSGSSPVLAANKKIEIPFILKFVMIFSAGMTLLMGILPGPFVDYFLKIAASYIY